MAAIHGADQVRLWRRSYDVRPPMLEEDDERHPKFDPRYQYLAPDLLPRGECLKDVLMRMLPYFFDAIVPDLMAEKNVLVSAHGNSLRAMIKHLDNIGDEEILDLEIPNGVPIIYDFDENFKAVKTLQLD
jgi:2,3-bisphosphoglycerate-dependent phosphoglycerate mutase